MDEEFEEKTRGNAEPAAPEQDAQEDRVQNLLGDANAYHPRPTYQKVLAWVLLAVVVAGVILWYLEIATSGKLFGILG